MIHDHYFFSITLYMVIVVIAMAFNRRKKQPETQDYSNKTFF